MDERRFDGPYRLLVSFRGPEWAFAIPQGDLDALDEVMRLCSQFWNGANALIVPVGVTGRIPESVSMFLGVRPVERCWLHEGLGARARDAVSARFSDASQYYDGFDEDEVHPLLLQPVGGAEEARPRVLVPRFSSARQRRGALCAWGYLHEPDRGAWHERFEVIDVEDRSDAARALIDGQTEIGSTSPLRLSARQMRVISQTNPFDWPQFTVFATGTFNDYVTFWNWRSRLCADVRHGAGVIALDRGLLGVRNVLVSFPAWLRMPPDMQRTPELLIASRAEDTDALDAAMASAGMVRDSGSKLQTRWGGTITPRTAATYRYRRPGIGGRFVRGTAQRILAVFNDGLAAIEIEQPPGLDIRGGHKLRTTLHDLPVPLPLTQRIAATMHPNASAFDGLAIPFAGEPRISFDLRLPTRAQALQAWAADRGATEYTLTQPFRYAEALLGRLPNDSALDALAASDRVAVLHELAPTQREKLAQRMRIEFARTGQAVDERALADHLKESALFLELQSRSAVDLGSRISRNRPAAIRALEPLVEHGFVVRGHAPRCPTCGVAEFRRLDELAERVQCRSCRATFTLPLTTGDAQEPPTQFQLDGLMARVMDQDVLSVLLALRALRRSHGGSGHPAYAWPGVEFVIATDKIDADLIFFAGGPVICCECKRNAATLTDTQLDGLLTLCRALDARPAIAGLENDFQTRQRELVLANDGIVLERDALLSS